MKARTVVDLLEPQTSADGYTEEIEPDWALPHTVHADVPAAVEPASTTEETLTADTVVSRWVCRLPVPLPGDLAVDDVTAAWRVRWRGLDHEIDGDIGVWEGRRGVQYLEFLLKRVTG